LPLFTIFKPFKIRININTSRRIFIYLIPMMFIRLLEVLPLFCKLLRSSFLKLKGLPAPEMWAYWIYISIILILFILYKFEHLKDFISKKIRLLLTHD
jgi:hypothetical protein